MRDELWTAIKLNSWLIVGCLIGIYLLLPMEVVEKVSDALTRFDERFSLLDFIVIEMPFGYWGRIVLSLVFVAAGLCFQYYARDYTAFFPSHLKFNVYFNPARLAAELAQFSQGQLAQADISIHPDWMRLRMEYLQDRNRIVHELDPTCRFHFGNHNHGDGYFSYKIIKSKGGRAQTYEAAETTFGIVDFNSRQDGVTETIMARFELEMDGNQAFHVKFRELLKFHGQGWGRFFSVRRYLIARPKLSQTAYVNLTTRKSIGNIVALSRLQYFPTVSLVSTVYLIERSEFSSTSETQDRASPHQVDSHGTHELNTMVPVAYAIYGS